MEKKHEVSLSDLGKRVHMVGIGGVGMSALAKFLVAHDFDVSGSDAASSPITDDLTSRFGVEIEIGEGSALDVDTEALIYSPAVPENNAERSSARHLDIPQFSYPEALGAITRTKKTITISGTNGKTTTTTMITELLEHLGVSPSAIIGEYSQKFNSNYIEGDSEYFVAEACEYKDSFLNLNFDIAVITNITEDHLDFFKDLEDIQTSFTEYLDNGKKGSVLICNTHLPELAPVVKHAKERGMKIVDYSTYLPGIEVVLPGEHNKQNGAAALAVVDVLKLSLDDAKEYLKHDFKGAKRRLEFVGETKDGAVVYDDYAHNPEALALLIETLRSKFSDKKLVMLFEPHLYSRTRDFAEDFAQELEKVDICYLFPTYRAREVHNPEEDFLLASYIDQRKVELHVVEDMELFLNECSYGNDTLIVTVGAGPIWKVGKELIKKS